MLLGVMCVGLAGCGAATHEVALPTDAPIVPAAFRMTPASDRGELPATRVQFVLIWPGGERDVIDVGVFVGACHPVASRASAIADVECWWGPRQTHLTASQRGRVVQVHGRQPPDGIEELFGEVRLRRLARARALEAVVASGDVE